MSLSSSSSSIISSIDDDNEEWELISVKEEQRVTRDTTDSDAHQAQEEEDSHADDAIDEEEIVLIHHHEAIEDFSAGDHVHQWWSCSRGIFHRNHGIVLEIVDDDRMKIVLLQNLFQGTAPSSTSSSPRTSGGFVSHDPVQIFPRSSRSWRKVDYELNWMSRNWRPRGTCSGATRDRVPTVLRRLRFLLENPHVLPTLDTLTHVESAAVWCQTGRWSMLRSPSLLRQAQSAKNAAQTAATLTVSAATVQVPVPAAGVWGSLGYTSQVTLWTLQPYLWGALIATWGAIAVGEPIVHRRRLESSWKEITQRLNDAYWEWSVDTQRDATVANEANIEAFSTNSDGEDAAPDETEDLRESR